jgi:hypothetical protein
MTQDSYIKIHNKFKQWCIDTFGENDYRNIYDLYSKVLVFKFQASYDSNGKLIKKAASKSLDNLFQSRVQNITNLLSEEHGLNKLLEAAKYTLEQHKIGDLPDKFKQISSFTNFVKNFKYNPTEVVISEVCIPKKYKKVRDTYDDNFYNFNYVCSCGNIFDPWQLECSKCKKQIDWRNRID